MASLTDAADGIADVFEDIEALSDRCRFTDCRYETEPRCAILAAAIEDGSLYPARLARWRRLRAEDAFNSAYGSLEEAFDAAELDALAIVTPDATHFSLAMAALERGLHVFCEKPLATNAADAARMREKADQMGVVHGVNLTYRNVAAVRRAREMIADGEIGEVRHFSAAYLQSWLIQPAWGDWRTSPE